MKKLKGVFKPLKRKFIWGINVPTPFIYCPKLELIIFRCQDVGWKDKYDTPRYENPPYIWIHLFKIDFIWYWEYSNNITDTDDYWEQALWYLYYHRDISYGVLDTPDIKKAKLSWPWVDMSGDSTWRNEFLIR